jgi:hypothetical protein
VEASFLFFYFLVLPSPVLLLQRVVGLDCSSGEVHEELRKIVFVCVFGSEDGKRF